MHSERIKTVFNLEKMTARGVGVGSDEDGPRFMRCGGLDNEWGNGGCESANESSGDEFILTLPRKIGGVGFGFGVFGNGFGWGRVGTINKFE